MTSFGLAKFPRSAVFVGVNLAMATFVMAFLVIPVVASFVERAERIADIREQLTRIRSVPRTTPLVDAGNVLLPGGDEGASGATLQSDLKSIAVAAGANFVAIRGFEPTRLGDASIISASIEVTGSVYAVREVVRRIEIHAPVFIIKSAAIRGRSADQDSELSAEFTVEGVMRNEQTERAGQQASARGGYGERAR